MGDATAMSDHASRGITYLTWTCLITATMGACFVLFPFVIFEAFGLLVYGAGGFPPDFGDAEADYVRLAHSVMGALMAGWFLLAAWHVRHVLPRRIPGAWSAMVGAFLVWFVLDTTYSLVAGFWPNALLNVAFLLAFAPGFWLTRSLRIAHRT